MKVQVRVEGQAYEVEVGDLAALPIVAVIDGRRFEVWPSGEAVAPAGRPAGEGAGPAPQPGGADAAREPAGSAPALRMVSAPIPGVVESIAVHAGDRVARGDELLVLEAMKMKNAIGAPRPGVILAVHVVVGQHVAHGDPLVEVRE
jgi:biotin carboxyl carrier protein